MIHLPKTHWCRLLRLHDRVWFARKHDWHKRQRLCQKIHEAMIRECIKQANRK